MHFFTNHFSAVIVFCFALHLFLCKSYSQSEDTLTVIQDTLNKQAETLTDSSTSVDSTDTIQHSLSQDTSESIVPADTTSEKIATQHDTSFSNTEPENDSIINLNGSFLGIRLGWTIGSFELVNQWQKALPDSLSHFTLNDRSFIVIDSTADSLRYSDTSSVKYLIKELPVDYNIAIPISLLFTKISDTRKTTLLLSFAYVGKSQKSVITGLIDSLSESVNIKQNLRTISMSIEGNYSLPLSERYFKIDGVDKSYLTLGASLSSIIVSISNNVDYIGESIRMDSIRSTVSRTLGSKSAIGAALSFRAGISTIRALPGKGFIEFGVSYQFSRNDYFYADSKRLKKIWINPGVEDFEKPLAFFTNKVELTVGVSKRLPR